MALDFKIDVPCVVQWNLLWFTAPTYLNRILGTESNFFYKKKHHDVVNGDIMDAIVKPFAWEVLQHTHKEKGIKKEMKGWRVKGDDGEEQSSNE